MTQGKNYNFQQGSVFYDTKDAYELEWGEAIKKIKFLLQIKEAKENDIVSKVVASGNVLECLDLYINGMVKFDVFKSTGAQLEKISEYECSHYNFLSLLQFGKFVDKNNITINLV